MAITRLSKDADMHTGFEDFAELKAFCTEKGYQPTLVEIKNDSIVKIGVVSKPLDATEEATEEGMAVYNTFLTWAEKTLPYIYFQNAWKKTSQRLEDHPFFKDIRDMANEQFAAVYYDSNSEEYVCEIRDKGATLKYRRQDNTERLIVAAKP